MRLNEIVWKDALANQKLWIGHRRYGEVEGRQLFERNEQRVGRTPSQRD